MTGESSIGRTTALRPPPTTMVVPSCDRAPGRSSNGRREHAPASADRCSSQVGGTTDWRDATPPAYKSRACRPSDPALGSRLAVVWSRPCRGLIYVAQATSSRHDYEIDSLLASERPRPAARRRDGLAALGNGRRLSRAAANRPIIRTRSIAVPLTDARRRMPNQSGRAPVPLCRRRSAEPAPGLLASVPADDLAP